MILLALGTGILIGAAALLALAWAVSDCKRDDSDHNGDSNDMTQ